jgi:hypothetical protein
MSKYCVDTSGLSHPYEEIPEDIHSSLWKSVKETIAAGHVAVTEEILGEIIQIQRCNKVTIKCTKPFVIM